MSRHTGIFNIGIRSGTPLVSCDDGGDPGGLKLGAGWVEGRDKIRHG